MTRFEAQDRMEELIGYFERLEEAKDRVSKLELDVRYYGLEKYAEELWKVEKKLDKIVTQMGIDITVLQVRIDRRANNQ